MIAWAAIAIASSTKARNVQIVSASCIAARSALPSRGRAVRHHQQRQRAGSACAPAGVRRPGRRPGSPAGRAQRRHRSRAPPGPPPDQRQRRAELGDERCRARSRRCRAPKPYTSTRLSTTFATLPTTATTSGVRVSWRPRRTPVAASISSRGAAPSRATRRYVVACVATSELGPNQATTVRVAEQHRDRHDHADQCRQPDPVDALDQRAAPCRRHPPAGRPRPWCRRRGRRTGRPGCRAPPRRCRARPAAGCRGGRRWRRRRAGTAARRPGRGRPGPRAGRSRAECPRWPPGP